MLLRQKKFYSTDPRSQSPYKLNPHQFIAPLKSSPIPPKPPMTPASTYRSCSPTRMVSSPARPTRYQRLPFASIANLGTWRRHVFNFIRYEMVEYNFGVPNLHLYHAVLFYLWPVSQILSGQFQILHSILLQPLQASSTSIRQPAKGRRGCSSGQGRTWRAAKACAYLRNICSEKRYFGRAGRAFETGSADQNLANRENGHRDASD